MVKQLNKHYSRAKKGCQCNLYIKAPKYCRFVNDVLQKRLKEFTEIDKRVDVVNGSFPIKRTHREFIVVTVMHL